MRLDHVLKHKDIIVGFVLNPIGRAYVIGWWKRRILNFDFDTWINNLHDSQ